MSGCRYDSLFAYAPSLEAAAVFAALFGLSTLLHLGHAVYFKTWLMMPLFVGALCKSGDI